MFTTSFTLIVLKLLTDTKFDIKILLTFSYIIAAVIGCIYILFNKSKLDYAISNMSLTILFLVFLFSFFHICSQNFISKAITLSPNISFCHLILNFNIIIFLIASYVLFNQKSNPKSIIGIIIALIGTSMVIYYSKE